MNAIRKIKKRENYYKKYSDLTGVKKYTIPFCHERTGKWCFRYGKSKVDFFLLNRNRGYFSKCKRQKSAERSDSASF